MQRILSEKALTGSLGGYLDHNVEAETACSGNRICTRALTDLLQLSPSELLTAMPKTVFEHHCCFLEAYTRSKKGEVERKELPMASPQQINFYEKDESLVEEEGTLPPLTIKLGEDIEKTKDWNTAVNYQCVLYLIEILSCFTAG